MKKEDINLGFPLGKVKRAKTIETFNGNWFVISSLIIPSQLQITTFKSYPEDVWLHGECSLISNNSFNNVNANIIDYTQSKSIMAFLPVPKWNSAITV